MKDIIKLQNSIISPYDNRNIDVISPDSAMTASIKNGQEFAMSAPVICDIVVGNLSMTMCSPSIIWSNDSRYLAIPVWRLNRNDPYWTESVYLVDILNNKMRSAPGIYIAITLNAFIGSMIYATHQEKDIEIDISKIQW